MVKGKILIVDDDSTVRDVLSDILRKVGGYFTDVASNGAEGLEKVSNTEYDVVFTDIMMPVMNGIDFLREAKSFNPSLPFIVITGFPSIDNAINVMKEGASDFITKPFKVDSVIAVTERILSEKRILSGISTKGDYDMSIERLNSELFKRLQKIAILQSISTELESLTNNNEVYEKIVEMASRLLMVKEVSFGIVVNGILKIKKAIGARECDISIPGSIFEHVLSKRDYYIAQFGEMNPYTGTPLSSSFFSIPLTINNDIFGILNLSDKADGTSFTDDDISLALTFAKKMAQRIENNALYEVSYNNLINTLKSLIISIEARDSYTKQHSERVTFYALEIAEVMNLSPEEKDAIRFGGYLHDIGKIGVRDTILLKPGKLSEEEMAEIRLHPVIGDNIIAPLKFFPKERELIRYHHESFDGNGYPDGLAGQKIPIIARILAVADTYDALTSSRPYRTARSHEFAVEELKRCSNLQFDSDVVCAFLQTSTGKGRKLNGA